MDVSGYPHYENVASRILAFYLNPKGEHGMDDLVLKSLLQLAEIESASDMIKVTIDLECLTEKGNRIDLVIRGEDFAIGIENKIFHWLANDLEDYSKTLVSIGKSKIGRILLSPNPITGNNLFGFKSITYPMLWEEVRKRMGQYIGTADNKWLTYLIDFMETTENFSSKGIELNDSDTFVLDNYASIESLLNVRNSFLDKLNHRIDWLKEFVEKMLLTDPKAEASLSSKRVWVHQRSCLVVDNDFNGIEIALDLKIQPEGWTLELLVRSNANIGFFNKLIEQMGSQENAKFVRSGRLRIGEWHLKTDLESIADHLLDANKRLIAAANAIQQSS